MTNDPKYCGYQVTVYVKGSPKLSIEDVQGFVKRAIKNYMVSSDCYYADSDIQSMLELKSVKVQ